MGNEAFKFHGSCVALPTPFRYGTVDFPALKALCYRQIDAGTAALLPCSATGEATLLTPGEYHRVVKATVFVAGGRVPVIAGVGNNSTQTSIEIARSAELAGARALLCVAPHYLKPTQAGLIVHFRAIHDAVGIPIILCDAPSRSACPMANVTIKRLADLPRVVGLKNATSNIPRVKQLRRRLGDRFILLSGDDASQAAYRLAGGNGCISVTANVAPALCSALQEACDQHDDVAAARLEQILAPLHAAMFLEPDPIPVKRALNRLKLIEDGLRLPLTPLSPAADLRLAEVLQAILPMEKATRPIASGRPRVKPRAA
jgi:4-hydroxy-tetrahydrodipicolinate synthase